MVTPTQAPEPSTPAAAEQQAIEKMIDEQLNRGERLIKYETREPFHAENISAVLDKYRGKGWKVSGPIWGPWTFAK